MARSSDFRSSRDLPPSEWTRPSVAPEAARRARQALRRGTFGNVLAVACSICVAAGCGSGRSAPPFPVTPAQGTVTYRGRPLQEATVVFAPVGGEHLALGRTDAEGRFRLSTNGSHDGARIGTHRVSVQAREPDRPLSAEEARQMGVEFRSLPGAPRIPERYFTADTSGLTAEVTSEGPNDFRFDLAD